MARNEEKANAMLNRFWEAKREEKAKPKEKRPFLASDCRDLADADKWRQQILREIGKKVMEIQNPGLGEERLKDLNDEINKLIREKGHWETRIVQLGGPNYAKSAPKITDTEGNEVDIASGKGLGYRYFGAAKQLPGVKELFEKPVVPKKRRNRYEMHKRIDMDYYGYRDDEDGVLEKLETVAEKEAVANAVADWERLEMIKEEAKRTVTSGEEVSAMVAEEKAEEEEEILLEEEKRIREKRGTAAAVDGGEREFVAHVPLPDDKEIERLVLERKKAELLSKYASEELVEQEEASKALLNIKR